MTSGNPDSAAPAPKKGLSPLAWIAIGCGCLVVVAGIAVLAGGAYFFGKAKEFVADFEENPVRTTAEMMVRANPDLEIVETDEAAETITFRDKKSGEVMTVNFADVREGRIRFETDEGEVTMETQGGEEEGSLTVTTPEGTATFGSSAAVSAEDLPSWLPLYPGARLEGAFTATSAEGRGGAFSLRTDDSTREVLAFYEERLEDQGFEVQMQTMAMSGEGTHGFIVATSADGARSVTVTVSRDDDRTVAAIQYGGPGD